MAKVLQCSAGALKSLIKNYLMPSKFSEQKCNESSFILKNDYSFDVIYELLSVSKNVRLGIVWGGFAKRSDVQSFFSRALN